LAPHLVLIFPHSFLYRIEQLIQLLEIWFLRFLVQALPPPCFFRPKVFLTFAYILLCAYPRLWTLWQLMPRNKYVRLFFLLLHALRRHLHSYTKTPTPPSPFSSPCSRLLYVPLRLRLHSLLDFVVSNRAPHCIMWPPLFLFRFFIISFPFREYFPPEKEFVFNSTHSCRVSPLLSCVCSVHLCLSFSFFFSLFWNGLFFFTSTTNLCFFFFFVRLLISDESLPIVPLIPQSIAILLFFTFFVPLL